MQKNKKVLVTGGAGFIGSWLVDKLIGKGYKIRILDNLEKQVHDGKIPVYLNKNAEFIKGDVVNYNDFKKALNGINIVFHLASSVGIGQSNYEVKKYTKTNVLGTANLAQYLIDEKHSIKKVIFPASMTGLGEGYYLCKIHKLVRPHVRTYEGMAKKDWELYCPVCDKIVKPVATNETAEENPASVYAITKKAQQDLLLTIGKIYKIPTVGLRLFNVYGPRQSLSNPYTGVTAIFISRIKNNQPLIIYEDGKQTRDFISVHDVVDAFIKSMNSSKSNYQLINIGSGKPVEIRKVADILSRKFNKKDLVKISNEFRTNDIRNCYADITKAKKILRWSPKISFEQGIEELLAWGVREKAEDKFKSAEKKMRTKGLL